MKAWEEIYKYLQEKKLNESTLENQNEQLSNQMKAVANRKDYKESLHETECPIILFIKLCEVEKLFEAIMVYNLRFFWNARNS